MIEIRVDELLAKQQRSFYWLAKETGISHTTLWRLKKGKALGINFETLEKLCRTLSCQPGEIIKVGEAKTRKPARKPAAARSKKR
jgi:putative transcriptional regulator